MKWPRKPDCQLFIIHCSCIFGDLLKVLPEKLFSWQNYYQPFLWTISITKELDIHLIIQAQFESQLTHSAEANS